MYKRQLKWSPFIISLIGIFIASKIVAIFFVLSLVFMLISFVTIFGQSKQMLYDKIAGTAVYELE